MTKEEYQKVWRLNHPENIMKYKAKRKKQRKCWHCKADIPWNRRICDTCACTTIICRMCGKSAKVLRSKRRYKASYFCSKRCQYAFFRKSNIWKMYEELQKLKATVERQNIDAQIIKCQQQQLDELSEKNQELRQQIKALNVNNNNQLIPMREIIRHNAKRKEGVKI